MRARTLVELQVQSASTLVSTQQPAAARLGTLGRGMPLERHGARSQFKFPAHNLKSPLASLMCVGCGQWCACVCLLSAFHLCSLVLSIVSPLIAQVALS